MATIVHRVQMGDNLKSISQIYYGSPHRWQRIYDDNRTRIGTPDHLQPGEHIVIR